MKKPIKKITEYRSHPYYIVAPPFRHSSGGIRALYYLCHALNELGYEAYIFTENGKTNPFLRTPELTPETIKRHNLAGLIPVAVYPEVVHGNILDLPVVARWILNKPGHLGGSTCFDPNEIIFYWADWVIPFGLNAQKLSVPIVDREVFNNKSAKNERRGFCFYANKYYLLGKPVSPILAANGIDLGLHTPRSPHEIAEILRTSEVLYCYEPSAIVGEANACGCPVIYIDTPYLEQFKLEDKSPLKISESEIGCIVPPPVDMSYVDNFLDEQEKQSWGLIKNFAKRTQLAAKIQAKRQRQPAYTPQQTRSLFLHNETTSGSRSEQITLDYLRFLNTLTPQVTRENDTPTSAHFTLICHVKGTDTGPLADTLDNLAALPPIWQLVVIAKLPAPIELDEIGCIHWLTTPSENHTNDVPQLTTEMLANSLTDQILKHVSQLDSDWIIEAPPGTRLEQSLFSALLGVDRNQTRAVFADNDYYDNNNQRHAPRFKPGVNPAALMSADLAGPLCITRDIWLTLNRSPEHPAPWLSSLWQVANKYGWHSIKHLPQVFFSLPDSVRHAPPDLIASLEADLANRSTPADLQSINPACWSVLWQLPKTPPSVQILVQTDGDLGLLSRCIEAISAKTDYPTYSLGLLVSHQIDTDRDPDLSDWLQAHQAKNPQTSLWQQGDDEAYSTFLNRVVTTVDSEFVLFFADELVVLQTDWLNELVRACQPSNVVGSSPRLIQPQTGLIENCGYVLGLQGWRGSAYFHQTRAQTPDDFDWIDASRDITTLTTTCALIRKDTLNKLGGFDDLDVLTPGLNSGFGLMLADFSLRCFKKGQRMIYAPRATLAGRAEPTYPKRNSLSTLARQSLADDARFNCFKSRWWPEFAHDPFWNPNLSLVDRQPTLETDFFADWMANPKPTSTPKILAHVIDNAQADFRVTDALGHLKQLQRVSTCVWVQRIDRPARLLTASEINRLNPDIHIVQNYVNNLCLAALDDWHKMPKRPFTVFALDDVVTAIDPSSPFFKNFSPDTRTSLSYALARCDRMVVSTDFLADYYRNFIRDIRVVPNRLEMKKWLPLTTQKRQTDRVRIGWAGGTTHQRDLMLLKEVIEQTRDEADWVFFGMCPPEIAPLLTESHPFIPYADYPAFLANLGLDLAVAPLAQTVFNRGKSNLRLLELGILGLPVVCTDIDPYQNSPACRVKNSVPAWVSALRERIHDPDAREREGRTMRQWVLQNYLLDNHLDEWLDAHTPG